jgi:hypothetical protein
MIKEDSMTVQEMIDELNKVENKNLEVAVPCGYRQVCTNVEFTVKEDFTYMDKWGYLHKAVRIYLGE